MFSLLKAGEKPSVTSPFAGESISSMGLDVKRNAFGVSLQRGRRQTESVFFRFSNHFSVMGSPSLLLLSTVINSSKKIYPRIYPSKSSFFRHPSIDQSYPFFRTVRPFPSVHNVTHSMETFFRLSFHTFIHLFIILLYIHPLIYQMPSHPVICVSIK